MYSFKLTIGKTAITNKEMYCNEAIAFFTNLKNISKEYLRIYLKLLSFDKIKHLSNSQIGDSLNKSTLGQIKIPILPPDHQERIVAYMDKIFGQDYKKLDKIVSHFKDYDLFKLLLNEDYAGFDQLLELYEDIVWAEAHYKRYCTTYKNLLIKRCFSMVPSKPMKLGDICKFDIGGTPVTKESKYWNGDNLWVSISDMNNDVVYNTERKITNLGVEKSSVKLIKKGSILYSFKLTIGKMAIAGKDMYCNEAIAFFNDIKINEKYFYFALKHVDYEKQKHLFNSQIGKALNKSTLDKVLIPVPSISDQEKVVKMIEEINKEESDFNQGLRAIGENIKRMYQCVEQLSLQRELLNSNEVEQLVESAGDIDDQVELSDDESDAGSADGSDSESEPEPEEIEIDGKTYILEGSKVYVKTKKGTKGDQYGTYTNGKVKKLPSPEEIDV